MLILLVPAALAITTRHDAADGDYIALAEPFAAVGHIDGCTGTLVAPDVVLTAAHCLDDDGDGEVDRGRTPRTFSLGPSWDEVTAAYAIDAWAMHPARTPSARERWDVALLYLTEPVSDIAPIAISAADPVGAAVVFVGYGGTGTGLDADYWSDDAYDGLKRAAQNTVDGRDEDRFGTGTLVADFDAPDGSANTMVDAYGMDSSADPLDLEGVTGPGDSGGPMLMEVDGAWRVVGVASAGWNPRSETGADERAGQYGSVAEHASLSLPETVDFLAEVAPEEEGEEGDTGAIDDGDGGDEGDTGADGGGADAPADGDDGGEKSGGCVTAGAPLGAWALLLPALVAAGRRRSSPS